MTRAELDKVLAQGGVLLRELGLAPKRFKPGPYEPETLGWPCPHCKTVFRIIRAQDAQPWVERHVVACEQRTERERKFYQEHRRWPARRKRDSSG